MKHRRLILALNLLLVITTIIALVSLALPLITIIQDVPSVKFGPSSYELQNESGFIVLPVTISSRGPLPLSGISLQGHLTDINGATLVAALVGPVDVPVGSIATLDINATFDFSPLPSNLIRSLLTTDQNLTLVAEFQASTFPLMTSQFYASGGYYWGAPLGNLGLGEPQPNINGPLSFQVDIPLHFNNNSTFFPVNGTAISKIHDINGSALSQVSFIASCPPGNSFYRDMLFSINLTQQQADYLFFNDSILNYITSTQISTPGIGLYNITIPLALGWGGLADNLTLGYPVSQYYNITHSKITIPLSFMDNSTNIGFDGQMSGTILNGSRIVVGHINNIDIGAQPNTNIQNTLTGYINNNALGDPSYIAHLIFQTNFGTFEKEVTLHA